MPPWKPAADSAAFIGDRRLSEREVALVRKWVDAGAPEGDRDSLRPPPQSAGGWLWGGPDLVLALPTYALRADGADVFRNFVVTVPGRGTHYVRALQFRPRSRAVHHANIRIGPTPASRALDEADPAPGYEGMILHSADYPDGHFLGWTPGQAPPPSRDLAWRLDGATDFVVQLHLRPTGRVEQIAPLIGLYFTEDPPARTPAIVRLGRQNLDIAPGDAAYRVSDSFVLPVEAQVVAIQPHAHYRARDVVVSATLPDGSHRSLIHIADWDFNWQDQYRLADPVSAPAGTTHVQACTLPMNGLTARQSLDLLALSPGQTLAVTGAAGAYGGYVVQLAKAEGLTVIADASEADHALVKALGADIVVRRGDDVATRILEHFPHGVDGLADGAVLNEKVIPAVRDGGAFTSVRGFIGAPQRGIRFTATSVRTYDGEFEKLDRLRQLVESGAVTLRVAATYPPERAADAHRRLEAGGTRGRLVITF